MQRMLGWARFWGVDYSFIITSVRILWVWGHRNDTICPERQLPEVPNDSHTNSTRFHYYLKATCIKRTLFRGHLILYY